MLKSLASMTLVNLTKSVAQFLIGTIVAAFVLPGQYGLIAFALPVINFATLFTDMGLASAVIRHPVLSARDAGAAFLLSLSVAVTAVSALALAAGPIERASGLGGLAPVLIGLALAVLFSIAATIPRALLERDMRYQRIAVCEIGALVVAASVSLTSIRFGSGIWAIVINQAVLHGLRATLFIAHGWRRLPLNAQWRRIAPLISFGGWVLASNLLGFAARNADNVLVGARLGAQAVGLYGMAYQFMTLPLIAISWPASGVLLSALSRRGGGGGAGGDAGAVGGIVIGLTQLTALVSFPLMAFLATELAFPVQQLLTPHWQAVVPLIRILAFAGAIQSIAAYCGAVLLAKGWARLNFALNVFNGGLLVTGFVVSLRYGLETFCMVYVALTTVTAAIGLAAIVRSGDVRLGAYLRGLVPPAAAALGAVVVARGLDRLVGGWPGWLLGAGAFALIVAGTYALCRRQMLANVRVLLAA